MSQYSSFCDDFYVDMCLYTKLDLPTNRDTILAFFERIERKYPQMTTLLRRGKANLCLKEQGSGGQFRWTSIERDRLASGIANPQDLNTAYQLSRFILDLVPYMLSISHLDIDSIELVYAMDFDCSGSHEEVIADAMIASSAFNNIIEIPGSSVLACSPAVTIGLDPENLTQARIAVESGRELLSYSDLTDDTEEPITLSLALRQFPAPGKKFDSIAEFNRLTAIGEDLMNEKVIGGFAKPLKNVIAQKKFN